MTNPEKVIEVDGDRFIKEIAEKICFSTYNHKVKYIQPPLCGNCDFGERCCNKWKCHTEDIVEWLKAEIELQESEVEE